MGNFCCDKSVSNACIFSDLPREHNICVLGQAAVAFRGFSSSVFGIQVPLNAPNFPALFLSSKFMQKAIKSIFGEFSVKEQEGNKKQPSYKLNRNFTNWRLAISAFSIYPPFLFRWGSTSAFSFFLYCNLL